MDFRVWYFSIVIARTRLGGDEAISSLQGDCFVGLHPPLNDTILLPAGHAVRFLSTQHLLPL